MIPSTGCGTSTYDPGARLTANEPSEPVVTRATSAPAAVLTTSVAPATGRGAQAESPGFSTGQTGPAVAVPCTLTVPPTVDDAAPEQAATRTRAARRTTVVRKRMPP